MLDFDQKKYPVNCARAGTHREQGIFISTGSDLKKNEIINHAEL